MIPTPFAATPIPRAAPARYASWPRLPAPLLLLALGLSAFCQAAEPTTPLQPVVLSPFVVQETDNVGYSATTTLSGTRLNTAIRDVGASISVVTPEFMNDIAATDLGTLLSYTLDTEVGGVSGNFAGGGSNTGRPDQNGARENPQDNQRVRGIGPASITRDYFLTDIPLDGYNISRVTMNRGPNSLLFGIGNPAGIIEGSLINAQLQRNYTTVQTRAGSGNSLRATLDHNQVLVRNRLALRLV